MIDRDQSEQAVSRGGWGAIDAPVRAERFQDMFVTMSGLGGMGQKDKK